MNKEYMEVGKLMMSLCDIIDGRARCPHRLLSWAKICKDVHLSQDHTSLAAGDTYFPLSLPLWECRV